MGERTGRALARELARRSRRMREDAREPASSSRSGRRSTSTRSLARCAEAAAARCRASPARSSRSSWTACRSSRPRVSSPSTRIAARAGAVGGPPDGSRVRAVGISYHYRRGRRRARRSGRRSRCRSRPRTGRLGFLTVFGSSEEPPVPGSDFQTLEAIAGHAGPAIESARGAAQPRPVAGVDRLTGLGNRRVPRDACARGRAGTPARAAGSRSACSTSTTFERTNARIGQIEGDALLVEIADAAPRDDPPADLAFRIGGDEFAVILPESGRIEAEGAVRPRSRRRSGDARRRPARRSASRPGSPS